MLRQQVLHTIRGVNGFDANDFCTLTFDITSVVYILMRFNEINVPNNLGESISPVTEIFSFVWDNPSANVRYKWLKQWIIYPTEYLLSGQIQQITKLDIFFNIQFEFFMYTKRIITFLRLYIGDNIFKIQLEKLFNWIQYLKGQSILELVTNFRVL